MQEYQSSNDHASSDSLEYSGPAARDKETRVAEAEKRMIRKLVANHKGTNGPCVVWVPAFDAETGLGYHKLNMDKTRRHSRGWSSGEISDYIARKEIPERLIEPDFNYSNYAAAVQVRQRTVEQTLKQIARLDKNKKLRLEEMVAL
ncbi:MAG: hypothetical protein AABX60_00640 [Nanoarchaeota archaeon]